MTIFVGDIHGEFEIFHRLLSREAVLDYPESIIQVGDFGHHPGWLKQHPFVAPPRPVYWIDGNHEWFPDLREIREPTELYPNCIYVPRGTVMELDGKQIGFLGGGDSIDKAYRTEDWDWFPEERIEVRHVDRLVENAKGKKLDILVTHVPPYYLIPALIDTRKRFEDASYCSYMVERAWNAVGRPTLVCGHFHQSYRHDNVHVLDINEFKEIA